MSYAQFFRFQTIDPDDLDKLKQDDNWLQQLIKKMHSPDSKKAVKGRLNLPALKKVVLPKITNPQKAGQLKKISSQSKGVSQQKRQKADVIYQMYGFQRKNKQKPRRSSLNNSVTPTTLDVKTHIKSQNVSDYEQQLYDIMTSNVQLQNLNETQKNVKELKFRHRHLHRFHVDHYRK